jgi:hypothetical protein
LYFEIDFCGLPSINPINCLESVLIGHDHFHRFPSYFIHNRHRNIRYMISNKLIKCRYWDYMNYVRAVRVLVWVVVRLLMTHRRKMLWSDLGVFKTFLCRHWIKTRKHDWCPLFGLTFWSRLTKANNECWAPHLWLPCLKAYTLHRKCRFDNFIFKVSINTFLCLWR